MVERMNSELANTLGNLVNRTIAMSNKYFGGLVENKNIHDDAGIDADLAAHREALVGLVTEKMDKLRVADALTEIFNLMKRSNKYIDETEPWKLAKDPAAADRLATVLYNLMDSILTGTTLLQSFMPETAEKIFAQIGASAVAFDDLGKSGNYPSGTKVTDKPEILFARMKMEDSADKIAAIEATQKARIAALTGIREEEPAEEKKEEAKEETPEAEPIAHKELCTYDDFAKCEFRVGEILECEAVKKSKKLLCSKVKIGPDEIVQICSGLRPQYTPEMMVGKKVMVIVNLAPRKMAGLESQGMILCAEGADGKLALMTPEDAGIDAGAEIC
jgi:methionyl-tRNA synthetase